MKERIWLWLLGIAALLASCNRESDIREHNHAVVPVEVTFPKVDIKLEEMWNYPSGTGSSTYDWQSEWIYGWDEQDEQRFGPIGYTLPTAYQLREYYRGDSPSKSRQSVKEALIQGNSYTSNFKTGFYDLLLWSEPSPHSGIVSLHFKEPSIHEDVTAYTNPALTTNLSPNGEQVTHFQPDELYAGILLPGMEITNRPGDYDSYDKATGIFHKNLQLHLIPVTYVYLVQVILLNNHGIVASVEGDAELTGMAGSTNLNTQEAGTDVVNVYYNMSLKKGLTYQGQTVDVIGGRLLTFGLPGFNPWVVGSSTRATGNTTHEVRVNVVYKDGFAETLSFDVSEQVRNRWKGGVITIPINVEELVNHGGMGAGVENPEEEEYEFEIKE